MKVLIRNTCSTSFKYRLLELPEIALPENAVPGDPVAGETVLVQRPVGQIGQPGGECADCGHGGCEAVESLSEVGK
jgi:hypothetical protein